jgi:ribonuclease PH
VQGSGEEATFDKSELMAMISLAEKGISELSRLQREAYQITLQTD